MENINTNVQKFNEQHENLYEQITTAAQRLTMDIKPLNPIERLTLPNPPPIDMKAITAKYSRMISESLHGNTTMNTGYKYTRDSLYQLVVQSIVLTKVSPVIVVCIIVVHVSLL